MGGLSVKGMRPNRVWYDRPQALSKKELKREKEENQRQKERRKRLIEKFRSYKTLLREGR